MDLYHRARNYITSAIISRLPQTEVLNTIDDGVIMVENAVRQGKDELRRSIIPSARSMKAEDLKTWKAAVQLAEAGENQDRTLLYDTYQSVCLDLQLDTVIDTRVFAVLSRRFKIVNDQTGEEDHEKTKLFEKPWFEDYVRLVVEAEFWGDTLIDIFDTNEEGLISNAELMPRKHVLWQKGLVVKEVGDLKGEDFRHPKYAPFYIPIEPKNHLGKLLKISTVVLAKRWSLAYWNQYGERYGQPFRTVTTPGGSESRDKALAKILENMGANGWGIFWEGEEFKLMEAAKSEGSVAVFEKLIKLLDGYISKSVLGQTMTTDDGSSKSQAQVHEDVAEDRHEYDRRRVRNNFNEVLNKQLISRGYPLEGFSFKWDDEMTDGEKLQRVISLSQSGYTVDPDYITEEFGIPIIGVQTPSNPMQPQQVVKKKSAVSRFPEIAKTIKATYRQVTCGCHVYAATPPPMDDGLLTKIINRIIQLIYNGKLRGNAQADLSLIVANSLHEALTLSFKMDTVEYDQPDNVATANMRNSIYAFAAAKSYSAIKAMTDKLFDADGEVKRFSEFKRDALEVHEQYNVDWLKSEYNHAVGSMQMSKRWLDYESQAEALPYLTYITAGDDRVRDSHAALDGVTRPVKDNFWNTNYPPNGWGCRCDVAQTNDDNLVTPKKQAEERAAQVEKQPMFNTNTGKTGIVFKDNHPYFSDVDGKVEELRAERDYGMRGLDSLLADRTKLPNQQEAVKDMDSWWASLRTRRGFGSNQVTLKDRNANAILLNQKTITDKGIAANVERVLASPSEVWFDGTATTYLKYHKDSVMMLKVDKNLVLFDHSKSTIKSASNAYSKERTGVLLHR